MMQAHAPDNHFSGMHLLHAAPADVQQTLAERSSCTNRDLCPSLRILSRVFRPFLGSGAEDKGAVERVSQGVRETERTAGRPMRSRRQLVWESGRIVVWGGRACEFSGLGRRVGPSGGLMLMCLSCSRPKHSPLGGVFPFRDQIERCPGRAGSEARTAPAWPRRGQLPLPPPSIAAISLHR